MVLKRSKGYEDIDASSNSPQVFESGQEIGDPDVGTPQEFEMASVSVVPDGNRLKLRDCLLSCSFCRYFYCDAGCKRTGFRVVSGQIIAVDGAMLDGR